MPTYVLSELKRTIAGDKVVDMVDVGQPTTQLDSLAARDRIPVFDRSAANVAKFVEGIEIGNPADALTTLATADRIMVRDASDTAGTNSVPRPKYITASNLLTYLQSRIVASVLSVSKPNDQVYTDNTAIEDLVLPEATGGTSPYTYTVTGLPGGLAFTDGTRTISGTPTATGVFTVTYTVVDAGTVQQTISQRFEIKVREATALALTQPADRNYVPNTMITAFALPAATGGLPPYQYVVTGLPDGLSFTLATRQVSGTPTEEGDRLVDYIAIDAENNRVVQTFTIDVKPAGNRYLGALTDTQLASLNQALIKGNFFIRHDVDETDLTLIDETQWGNSNRKIVIAQPAAHTDLSSISLAGFGNSISEFTKRNTTVTVDSVAYDVWVGNDDQGNVIAGQIIEVRP